MATLADLLRQEQKNELLKDIPWLPEGVVSCIRSSGRYIIICAPHIQGWQVCVENCRAGIEPEFYANDIHTDHDAAVKEFEDTIQQLKTDTEGNIDWLANALESTPRDIRERAEGKYLVEFTDLATDDKLSVYINEVEIK